jgi:sugar fermentation stimulation protein A
MTFSDPLIPGKLIKRYKRFLADVELENGEVVTAHCPNSGTMKTCADPGFKVMLSPANNPKRKLKYTLEMTHNGTCWIGVNTQRPNEIVYEALIAGEIPELAGYDSYRREVKYGKNSRIDVLAESADRPPCWIEVKNTTLLADDGCLAFPDAVTERGRKHLEELMNQVAEGDRAVMVFLCNRSDCSPFRAAREIDPKYADKLDEARAAGVEIFTPRTVITPESIRIDGSVPLASKP